MKSLLDSRKFWLTLSGALVVAAVGVTGILTHAEREYIIAIIAAVSYQVGELVKGIAREDAAKVTPAPSAVAVANEAPKLALELQDDEPTSH